MAKGYMRAGRVAGVELRLHWSSPFALLLWTLAFGSGGRWLEVAAVVSLVYLVHGFGHWAVARGQGFKVHRLELSPLGVHGTYSGTGPRSARTWVAFGGVMAHMLLGMAFFLVPSSGPVWQAAVGVNLLLGAINLLPAGSLDGAEGWPLVMGPSETGHSPTSTHPSAQRARLVRELDRDMGHPRGRRRVRRPPTPTPREPPIPAELVDLADQLMEQARADVRRRTEREEAGEE